MATVLIADDEANVRKFVRALLEGEGHSVLEAGDGQEALEVSQAGAPDLLILDVRMPRLTGFDVLRKLQTTEGQEDRRVLFLTGATDEEDFLKGWGYGADGYLSKPLEADHLVDAVNEILALTPQERVQRREHEIERARMLRQLDRFLD